MTRNQDGATAVVDRTNGFLDEVGGPTTRDIPLPPRSVRLGLTPPTTTPRPDGEMSVLQALGIQASENHPVATTVAVPATEEDATGELPRVGDIPVIDEPGAAPRTARGEGPSNSLKARTALVAMAAGAVAVAVASSGNTLELTTPIPLA
ncbi:MAG: hypothetical protein WAW85_06055, partial [Gordonia sp. (in: high G+C Gram-positive bacteria)]